MIPVLFYIVLLLLASSGSRLESIASLAPLTLTFLPLLRAPARAYHVRFFACPLFDHSKALKLLKPLVVVNDFAVPMKKKLICKFIYMFRENTVHSSPILRSVIISSKSQSRSSLRSIGSAISSIAQTWLDAPFIQKRSIVMCKRKHQVTFNWQW